MHVSQAKTSSSVGYTCVPAQQETLNLHPCGHACCWSQCCFGMTSIRFVLLILCLLQVCVTHIPACVFVFISDKVESKKSTLYLVRKVAKSVLVLPEEQVPCSGVNLHEIAVFCILSFMLFYKIPELLIMAFIFIALRTEGYKFSRETFSWVHTNLKDSHILGTFISKPCLPEQPPDLSRLPSLIPLFSVCQPVPCPSSPQPFCQESSTALQRMKRFSPSALQVQSLRYRDIKWVAEGY